MHTSRLPRPAALAIGLLVQATTGSALAQSTASATAAAPPNVSADEKGLSIKSADGSYGFKIKGLLQIDSRWFFDDRELAARDTMIVRRARPVIDATLLGMIDVRFVPDFAEGRAQIFDSYLDVRPAPWLKFRFGKFKPPVGLERLQSDPDIALLERALTSNLSPSRDVGVQIFGDLFGGFATYAAGVFDGSPDNGTSDIDSNHAKDFAARLFLYPFARAAFLGALGVGAAASTGNQLATLATPGLPTFRSSGQNAFFNYTSSATDVETAVLAYHRRTRFNPELSYYAGPVGILCDYIMSKQTVRRGSQTADLTHTAWHVTSSAALGGKVTFEGVIPDRRFDPKNGAWGAIELAARLSQLSLDDDTFPRFASTATSPRDVTALSIALSWYLGRSGRFAVEYDRTTYEGATAPPREHENFLMTRAQATF